MAETSDIGWTESTWNPWTGCDKVSDGCANCYMFRWAKRAGRDPEEVVRSAPRTFTAPLRWQRDAVEGEHRLVFTCSLSDWFHRAADEWRREAWSVIERCPDLFFQVLTKRHGRIAANLPDGWGDGWANVALGVSVESDEWMRRARLLNQVPARVRFLSMEPLLSRVNTVELRAALRDGIGWVIVGGESGGRKKVREFHEAWALDIVDACAAEGVPVFVKQRGAITMPLEGGIEIVPHNELATLRPELDVRQMPAAFAPAAAAGAAEATR